MNVIDRKQASDMLGVSIRTIDRYIQRGVLDKEEINGRIFIDAKALKPLLDKKKIAAEYISSIQHTQSTHHVATPAPQASEDHFSAITSTARHDTRQEGDDQIYKNLYEELQEELKTKQERLEGANYRVGQLEGLLKESVPLLDYRKALSLEAEKRDELENLLKHFEKDNETLNQTVESRRTELEQLSRKLALEKFNKKVFVTILIILFLLQPLWLLFPPTV